MSEPRIAIIYDRINKFGGAERVLIALHEAFPHAVFFTSVYDSKTTPWTKGWEIRTSFLQSIPFAKNHHDKFALFMPLVFELFDLSDFEIIISVTSEYAKAVITNPNQLHICYCLTPTRYLWSHTQSYEGKYLRLLKRLVFHKLRLWDYITSKRPDCYVAISQRVRNRIEKYYQSKVDTVIYPPVDITSTSIVSSSTLPSLEPYYLVVSRLIPYKRVDLAINACLHLHKKLVIVGTGSEEQNLRQLAMGNKLIHFSGFVPDEKLHEYYAGATALICPQEEDFGIVSLEAQSHGVPVISYLQSGVAETIIPERTGLLFTEQIDSCLEECIEKFENMKWDRKQISSHASTFSKENFIRTMQQYVAKTYSHFMTHTVQ